MFDFIRKSDVWEWMDADLHQRLEGKHGFQLKTIQDMGVYCRLDQSRGSMIGEVGGGDSRILRLLAQDNECYNIDRFEGTAVGPKAEIEIENVNNVKAFLGDFDAALEDNYFDILFSVSVVEHVTNDLLKDFFLDCARVLKPGGLMLHAIDFYLEDEPAQYARDRFQLYKEMFSEIPSLSPTGEIHAGPLGFTCDMATNPDNIMHLWGKYAPNLIAFRQKAQSVALMWSARKVTN